MIFEKLDIYFNFVFLNLPIIFLVLLLFNYCVLYRFFLFDSFISFSFYSFLTFLFFFYLIHLAFLFVFVCFVSLTSFLLAFVFILVCFASFRFVFLFSFLPLLDMRCRARHQMLVKMSQVSPVRKYGKLQIEFNGINADLFKSES